jgi:P pilus assembly chaperone PapD
MSDSMKRVLQFILATSLNALVLPSYAQFALAVVPPRFELKAKPGDKLREVIELSNSDSKPGKYSVKTADWTMQADASVDFQDDLQANSCRPWVAIERKEVTIAPNRPYRYRFEVNVPADAKPTECRFAIMIEGQQQTANTGAVSLPFAARLGLIVYVAVGDVKSGLTISDHKVITQNNQPTAIVKVENKGTATGRLGGYLTGTDSDGSPVELTPIATPILPGQTRNIAFTFTRPNDPNTAVTPKFPVQVKGKIEAGEGNSIEFNRTFAR